MCFRFKKLYFNPSLLFPLVGRRTHAYLVSKEAVPTPSHRSHSTRCGLLPESSAILSTRSFLQQPTVTLITFHPPYPYIPSTYCYICLLFRRRSESSLKCTSNHATFSIPFQAFPLHSQHLYHLIYKMLPDPPPSA